MNNQIQSTELNEHYRFISGQVHVLLVLHEIMVFPQPCHIGLTKKQDPYCLNNLCQKLGTT